MANDALALSDIIHTMSPSPGPHLLPTDNGELTQEPIMEPDIARMRRRASEVSKERTVSLRERELVDMVRYMA